MRISAVAKHSRDCRNLSKRTLAGVGDDMEWIIFCDAVGRWGWEYGTKGELVRQSSKSFPTRKECLADARQHGYSLIFSRRASARCSSVHNPLPSAGLYKSEPAKT